MRDLTIRSCIYGGSGILVALAVAVAGFAAWELLSIQDLTTKPTRLSTQAARVSAITLNTELMRRTATTYRLTSEEKRIDEFKAASSRTSQLLTEAFANSLSEDRKRTYASLQEAVKSLSQKFDLLTGANAEMLAAKANLFKGGDELTAASNKVADALTSSGKEMLASHVQAAIFLVRIANWRFLATNDPKGVATFKTNV